HQNKLFHYQPIIYSIPEKFHFDCSVIFCIIATAVNRPKTVTVHWRFPTALAAFRGSSFVEA
ncbi:MAG: hypothetical protein II381_06700, partial [Victivallales bacterium]|nr:hypothetical protein [Victivallales bacterium]